MLGVTLFDALAFYEEHQYYGDLERGDEGDREAFGFLAVGSMVIMYALEERSHIYVLGFAASCAAASLYAVIIHSWPFAVVEGVWAVVALRRWVRGRPRAEG